MDIPDNETQHPVATASPVAPGMASAAKAYTSQSRRDAMLLENNYPNEANPEGVTLQHFFVF